MWAGFVTIVGQHEHIMGYLEIILLYRQEYLTSLLFFQLGHYVVHQKLLICKCSRIILVLLVSRTQSVGVSYV